jgi:hypothetical protein
VKRFPVVVVYVAHLLVVLPVVLKQLIIHTLCPRKCGVSGMFVKLPAN